MLSTLTLENGEPVACNPDKIEIVKSVGHNTLIGFVSGRDVIVTENRADVLKLLNTVELATHGF